MEREKSRKLWLVKKEMEFTAICFSRFKMISISDPNSGALTGTNDRGPWRKEAFLVVMTEALFIEAMPFFFFDYVEKERRRRNGGREEKRAFSLPGNRKTWWKMVGKSTVMKSDCFVVSSILQRKRNTKKKNE